MFMGDEWPTRDEMKRDNQDAQIIAGYNDLYQFLEENYKEVLEEYETFVVNKLKGIM